MFGEAPLNTARIRSGYLVFGLTMMTFGVYGLYWSAGCWNAIRRAGGDSRLPGWLHAVGVSIPFYGAYRVGRHAASVNRLMGEHLIRTRISTSFTAGLCVIAWLLVSPLAVPIVDVGRRSGLSVRSLGVLLFLVSLSLFAAAVGFIQAGLTAGARQGLRVECELTRIDRATLILAIAFWSFRLIRQAL